MGFLSVATCNQIYLTILSFPAISSVTLANFQKQRDVPSFLINTISPMSIGFSELALLALAVRFSLRLSKYSRLHYLLKLFNNLKRPMAFLVNV